MTLPVPSNIATSALPAINIHSHGHGHNKGLDAPQASAGSTQDLFGSLMTSLEQVIGTQPTKTAAVGQTNTQVAPATSALGDAAKSVLGAVGTALKLFA